MRVSFFVFLFLPHKKEKERTGEESAKAGRQAECGKAAKDGGETGKRRRKMSPFVWFVSLFVLFRCLLSLSLSLSSPPCVPRLFLFVLPHRVEPFFVYIYEKTYKRTNFFRHGGGWCICK